MFISSLDFIKLKRWEIFSFIHMLYPLYLFFIILHGCGFWFNYKFPLSIPFISIPILIQSTDIIKRIKQRFHQFKIINISLTEDKSVAFIKIKVLKGNFFVLPGQYLFLNIPEISKFQWHPFSISSTLNNGILQLMIKDNGDFTHTFIDKLYNEKIRYLAHYAPKYLLSDYEK